MWAHCRELRTNPAAKPPKYANKKARLVIIENIPSKFQAWHWDTTDPENCVPMDNSNRFRPTLHGKRVRETVRRVRDKGFSTRAHDFSGSG